jgi:hypothetical protein
MNKYQAFGLISGQVLMGLLFGFGGVIVTAFLGTVYEEVTGNYTRDLSTSILYSLYGGYVGMQIGIGYDGHKYLKEKGRLRDFKRFFGQSILGLFLGLLTFYYFFLSPGHINNIFMGLLAYVSPVMPLVGAIIGFDFGITKELNENVKKNG